MTKKLLCHGLGSVVLSHLPHFTETPGLVFVLIKVLRLAILNGNKLGTDETRAPRVSVSVSKFLVKGAPEDGSDTYALHSSIQ